MPPSVAFASSKAAGDVGNVDPDVEENRLTVNAKARGTRKTARDTTFARTTRVRGSEFDCRTDWTYDNIYDWGMETPSMLIGSNPYARSSDVGIPMEEEAVELTLDFPTRLSTIHDGCTEESNSCPTENNFNGATGRANESPRFVAPNVTIPTTGAAAYNAAVEASIAAFHSTLANYKSKSKVPVTRQYSAFPPQIPVPPMPMYMPPMPVGDYPAQVPKTDNKAIKRPSDKITTFMLRNVPNKYSRTMLRQELAATGFANTYDFLYLPIDFKTQCNFGYAFINFFCGDDTVRRFVATFTGRLFLKEKSSKLGQVVPAKLQGKMPNADLYRFNAVMMQPESYQPQFYDKRGNVVPFPEAPVIPLALV